MRWLISYCVLYGLAILHAFGQEQSNVLIGKFENAALGQGRTVVLMGYEGKRPQCMDTTVVAADGSFTLQYPSFYRGMGQLQVEGVQGEIPVILTPAESRPQPFTFTSTGNLVFSPNSPNGLYYTYRQKGDKDLSRLDQIGKLSRYYQPTEGFGLDLAEEQKKVELARNRFLSEIDTLRGDVGYFLRLQESLMTMNILLEAQTQPPLQRLKDAQYLFERVFNFDDDRLWHSGILHRLAYSYFRLSSVLEGGVQHASDFLASSLANSPYKNTYIEEIIGVIQAQPTIAEYFSQKMLEANQQCDDIKGNDMPSKIKRQLEQYSLLKVGNTAPDELLQNGKHISELPAAYKLIVFWASWCEHCQKEIPELRAMYADLKKQDIEVVAMGMDDNAQIHQIVSQANPWVSHFVGRDWNAPTTQRYHVFGTPTYFLVDKNRKIVARPKSVSEVAQWLNRNKM